MNAKTGNRRPWSGRVALALAAAWTVTTLAAAGDAREIDFNLLMNETLQQSPLADRMTFVWWLPEEFWEWSIEQGQALSDAAGEEFLAVLRPYALFVVLDGTIGPMGGVTFRDAASLRETVVLVDAKGGEHRALAGDGVSADARNLVTVMRPLLANMLGPTGENMTFFFFPAKTGEGAAIAGAKREGSFSVKVDDQVFKWKTPLASVLAQKVCPVDGEEMSGAWSYCPWHGKKLAAGASGAE